MDLSCSRYRTSGPLRSSGTLGDYDKSGVTTRSGKGGHECETNEREIEFAGVQFAKPPRMGAGSASCTDLTANARFRCTTA
ncbi:hypothetical protein EVAR_102803_1 [Eumeta japonica]|uniref:Uncharacterized protein n=1 Tax=Eumeta variegata TaxID=151549 RepID=A0A4C1TIW3_EUMVA|nr:hypothetical protein EVAR_102803_1 [Eumeta japonica]